jgi:peptide/nickel transport system substrate-binding protein
MLRKALLVLAVGLFIGPAFGAEQTPRSGGLLKFAVGAEPPNYDCHANSSLCGRTTARC